MADLLVAWGHDLGDLLAFYFPLGVIGIWRWSVWILKKMLGRRYRPAHGTYHGSVSIVTPVYNEDPAVFKRALCSWQASAPREIIAVIDHTDIACQQAFRQFAAQHHTAKLIVTTKPGKRQALADGAHAAAGDIIALVDSDTLWAKNLLAQALPPFNNPRVGGVATRQNVLTIKTVAQALFDIQLDLRYADEMPYLAANGTVLTCLSGRTALYRRQALMPMLADMVNETFWGKPVISGEDKRLTYLVAANGWQLAFQQTARVYTPGADTLMTFLKQRLRWTRNSWRANVRAMWEGWVWHHPAFAFFITDQIVQPFVLLLSPIYFITALVYGHWLVAVVVVVWWHASRFVRLWPHLQRRPADILMLPAYLLFTFAAALIRLYALFTINQQGWITRWDKSRLQQLTWLKRAPSYVTTALVVIALSGAVQLRGTHTPAAISAQIVDESALNYPPTDQTLMHTDTTNTARTTTTFDAPYRWKSGDTLELVARRYHTTVADVQAANPQRNFVADQVITVPLHYHDVTDAAGRTVSDVPAKQTITYDHKKDTIIVTGPGTTVTVADIARAVGPDHVEQTGPKIWLLKTNLQLNRDVMLELTADEVTDFKLTSSPDSFVWIRTVSGRVYIEGVRITSWNENTGDYDYNWQDGRAYILARFDARMDIVDSELAYLGYSPTTTGGGNYGASWRNADNALDTYLITGEVRNSIFHHNYYGAYTFGAVGMNWLNNTFYENVVYGLDPHDDSNYALIIGNRAHHNGRHGIIVSERCRYNTFRDNISDNNKGHGIMIHEDSHGNLIEYNTAYNNQDGIVVYRSSDNIIRYNTVRHNERGGIRINNPSVGNVIEHNELVNNSGYGIYLYRDAVETIIRDNMVVNSRSGIYVKTNDNVLQNNKLTGNRFGIHLRDGVRGNTLTINTISHSQRAAIYLEHVDPSLNHASNNVFESNENTIITAD